jgi:hypothetical protein
MDLNEPNETEAEAPFLGTIDDWDQSGQMAFGVLEDTDDVDWFHYFGTDEVGFIVDPERQVFSSGQTRLCKYVECWNGLAQTVVTCPSGTTTDTSPDGRPGCCSFTAFAVHDVNCVSTIDEDLDVYVRIDQPSAACLSYTLQYHF